MFIHSPSLWQPDFARFSDSLLLQLTIWLGFFGFYDKDQHKVVKNLEVEDKWYVIAQYFYYIFKRRIEYMHLYSDPVFSWYPKFISSVTNCL